MAILTGNTIYFSGEPFSLDNYGSGADIRKVANGFTVTPRGCDSSSSQTYVFKDATELSAWVRKQYTPKPAKKSGRKAGR